MEISKAESGNVIKWFSDNKIIVNPDKFKSIISQKGNQTIKPKQFLVWSRFLNASSFKLLGIHINDQLNPLSVNPIKWSNTLKQFVGNLPMNCLSVFDHFVKSALKELRSVIVIISLHYKETDETVLFAFLLQNGIWKI